MTMKTKITIMTTNTSTIMNNTLIRAVMGSLLCGGFLHFSFAQEFIQDLGNSTVVAEQSSETILNGLREDEVLKDEKLDRKISTTIAETIKTSPTSPSVRWVPPPNAPSLKGFQAVTSRLPKTVPFAET